MMRRWRWHIIVAIAASVVVLAVATARPLRLDWCPTQDGLDGKYAPPFGCEYIGVGMATTTARLR